MRGFRCGLGFALGQGCGVLLLALLAGLALVGWDVFWQRLPRPGTVPQPTLEQLLQEGPVDAIAPHPAPNRRPPG